MSFNPGTDTFSQPLRDAWWTPGWTAQNQSYIPVPPNQFQEQGFPPGLVYINVIGNYFDLDGNGNSGFLTFWPSSTLTITAGSPAGTAILEQRFAGLNENMLGMNQFGNGKIYLWNGQLTVALLATDQPSVTSMFPSTFSYHVLENFIGGREYDITVPSSAISSNTTGTDINSLIVPGSIVGQSLPSQTFPAFATENIVVSLTELVGVLIPPGSATIGNPAQFQVQFSFTATQNAVPSTWYNGIWATTSAPYIAEILVGPSNGGIERVD